MKQEKLNQFLRDFADFLEKYYSSSLSAVSQDTVDGAGRIKLQGLGESLMEVWADNEEITVIFGDSHWHIDDYNNPCCYENIYENTIDSVLEVLKGEISAYSCWSEQRACSGGTFHGRSLDEARKASQRHFHGSEEIHIKTWGKEKTIHGVQQPAPADR